jgi:predicted nucleic acid-binding protein
MRLLLDTNILARAAAGPPGLAHDLLIAATQHVHSLIVSQFMVADVVDVASPAAAISSDPDDDPILAAAPPGQAHVICTLDRHLFQPRVLDFCAALGIEVLSDLDLLARLRSQP